MNSPQKEKPKKPASMIISWEAQRFENVERHPRWHLIIFVVLVGLLAYGLFTDNFLLSIISILVGLLIYMFEKMEPRNYKFGITPEGVFAHDKIYEYSHLEDFWIFYEPGGRKELSLKSEKTFMPYIHVPLGDANPTKVRKALIKFLPELEHEESFVDALERFF